MKYCQLFGYTPTNRIMELFLEMRELDFAVGDIAKETKLNRATTYNTIGRLIRKKHIILSRRVSGSQLYKLNTKNQNVKLLIKIFNIILKDFVNSQSRKKGKGVK